MPAAIQDPEVKLVKHHDTNGVVPLSPTTSPIHKAMVVPTFITCYHDPTAPGTMMKQEQKQLYPTTTSTSPVLLVQHHHLLQEKMNYMNNTTSNTLAQEEKYNEEDRNTTNTTHNGILEDSNSDDAHDDILEELLITMDLLESRHYEDNRYGMERLVRLVNSEFINRTYYDGSVSQALVCKHNDNDTTPHDNDQRLLKQRLRRILLKYVASTPAGTTNTMRTTHITKQQNKDRKEEYKSSEETKCWSDVHDEDHMKDQSVYYNSRHLHRASLKLPALRVLASALQLIQLLLVKSQTSISSQGENITLDLSEPFWRSILHSLAEESTSSSQAMNSKSRVEATLVVKIVHLLFIMQPKTMDQFIRYSMLPHLMHVYDIGLLNKDHFLVRECERILRPMGFCN